MASLRWKKYIKGQLRTVKILEHLQYEERLKHAGLFTSEKDHACGIMNAAETKEK